MLTKSFGGANVKIKTLHSGGTIKKVERKLVGLTKKWVMKRAIEKTEVRKDEVEK